jgi:probable selenium-dependent hydroxylase accessory protein YqeC
VDLDDDRPPFEGFACRPQSDFDRLLLRALDLDRRGGGVLSIIGAGGKTTLMYAVAHALVGKGHRVVTSTTTKILPPTPGQSHCVVLQAERPDLDHLSYLLSLHSHITVGGSISKGKVEAPEISLLSEIREITDWLILEADGAAGKPIKAPEAWEPVVPDFTDILIVVIGLDALNRPATEDTVFRLERFLEITGISEGDPITSAEIVKLLLSPNLTATAAHSSSSITAALNKTDSADESDMTLIKHELNRLNSGRYQGIVFTSLKDRTVDFFKPE